LGIVQHIAIHNLIDGVNRQTALEDDEERQKSNKRPFDFQTRFLEHDPNHLPFL